MRLGLKCGVAVVVVAVGFPRGATAQGIGRAPAESVMAIPGARYKAGGLHQFLLGSRYRALWTARVKVPVLDLKRFAGGLTPTRKGGGQQTHTLRLQGADGRLYQFRSIAKDPTTILPPELKDTWAADLLQDQMSSALPFGPGIVPPLLEAAGVLHTEPRLFQMPDDPALGEFRAEFGGLLGFIEERPTALAEEDSTIGGASRVVNTEDLFKRLDDDPAVRVDSRAFLHARLMDVFMGDWDRHDGQWRWGLVDSGGPPRWLPIPLDRDQVFVRFDGLLLSLIRKSAPQLRNFGPGYGDMVGATWNGRDLDRRLLVGLERATWDSVAAELKSKLSDAVIDAAVQRMPPEFVRIEGPRLERALKARRDHLDRMADRYYRMLAHQVDVFGTDKADEAKVNREGPNTLVTLSAKGHEYFRRRFKASETQELRLRLQGGDDRLEVSGPGGGPLLRVIGGGGDDHYSVNRGGGVHLYDDRGHNESQGAGINTKPWRWKPDSLKPNQLPPRDWGRATLTFLNGTYNSDVAVVVGYGGYTDWYAFRRVPYSTRFDYKLEVATGKVPAGRATLGLTRQFENSAGFYALNGMASNIEILRWYGFGNETTSQFGSAYNRVNESQLLAGVKLGYRFGRSELSFGPLVRWSSTSLTESHNAVRFIALDHPYGTGRFGMVGVGGRLTLEGRDHPHFASKGGSLVIQGSAYPAMWDAEKAVGTLSAEGSFALAPQGRWRPTLSLLAGGAKTWGKLPFFMAATLGGSHTLRGYRPQRFAGDAAVYGSAELRVPVLRATFILPGEQGIFGFVDGGRVFVRGESSNQWHSTAGGGLWFSLLGRDNVIYVGAGAPTRGGEGARLILGFGFPR